MNTTSYRLPSQAVLLLFAVAVVGIVTLVVGLVADPQRTWLQLLLVSYYLAGLALGGLLLVALLYVTGARWSNAVRRIPEAMFGVLPIAAGGIAAVLILRPSLYPWTEPGAAESPLQHLWLNRPFFVARAFVYLGLWLVIGFAIVRNSRRQDYETAATPTRQNVRLSAAFLVVFGVTFWLASCDWIMSLEPRWASTIFSVYNFAGVFVSGLAAAILLVVWLRKRSALQSAVTDDHLHDLGTLLFAFSSFWMYCWFCQYLLIWYVNNPEETAYLRQRWQGSWPTLLFLDLILGWAIPFIVLLFRGAKRSPRILSIVALIVLAGRWVDLDVMILPSQKDAVPAFGWIEGGLVVGGVAMFLLAFFRMLAGAPLVPVHEPAVLQEAHGNLLAAGHG
jgi:hypothetical protein